MKSSSVWCQAVWNVFTDVCKVRIASALYSEVGDSTFLRNIGMQHVDTL
jgi:hypothetical protein